MKYQNMFSRSIGFQKTAIAGTLGVISSLQHHGEALLKTTLEQNPWISESNRKACCDWTEVCVKNFESMKDLVDQGLAEMDRIFTPSPKQDKEVQQQTATKAQRPDPLPAKKTSSARRTAPIKKTALQEKPDEKKAAPNKSTALKSAADTSAAFKVNSMTTVPQDPTPVLEDKETP